MKTKLSLIKVCLFLGVTGSLIDGIMAQEKRARMHPSFVTLLKLYPRDKEIVNPMVPRIDAKTAFSLYMRGKAIFFATDNSPLFPGAKRLGKIEKVPIGFLNKHKDKIFILYCA